ncbi:MAG: YybS family protein [Desulfobacterales bacterium]
MPHNNRRTDILKGTGIICLIFLLSVHIPLIGFFISLLIPLPVLFFRTKLGRKNAGTVFLLSVLIIFFSLGRISFDLLYFAGLMLLGFVLAEMFEKKLTVEHTVLRTAGIVAGAAVISVFFYSSSTGRDLGTVVSEYVALNLKHTLQLYTDMGMPEDAVQLVSDSLETIHYGLVRILPALTASALLFLTWSVLLMASPLMRAGKLPYPDFGPLTLWKVPEVLVWGVVGCGLALMFPNTVLRILAFNGLIVLMTVYFFGGIAIVAFYFEKKQLPPMLRVFFYSMIALWHMALLLVIGLGFFDMWLNFRKLETGGANG